jgi:uncharacterized Zn finger protein
MSEVKPGACPACGPGNSMVSAYLQDLGNRWQVGCGACGLHSGLHRDRQSAIAAWNAIRARVLREAAEIVKKRALGSESEGHAYGLVYAELLRHYAEAAERGES